MTLALCPFSSLALGSTTAISVTVTSQCSENTRVSARKLGRSFIFSFSPKRAIRSAMSSATSWIASP